MNDIDLERQLKAINVKIDLILDCFELIGKKVEIQRNLQGMK